MLEILIKKCRANSRKYVVLTINLEHFILKHKPFAGGTEKAKGSATREREREREVDLMKLERNA